MQNNQEDFWSSMGFESQMPESADQEVTAPPEQQAQGDPLSYMGFDTPGRSHVEQQGVEPFTPVTPEQVFGETPDWVARQRQGIEEAFNPAEVFAGIFSGGTSIALRHGMKLGPAALRGMSEAAIGTLADVPISLASQVVREKYGWGPALVMELTAGLASGMTIENYILKKLGSIGRVLGRADSLKDFAKLSPEERAKQLDELDEILRVVDDAPEIQKALPPGSTSYGDSFSGQVFRNYEINSYIKSTEEPIVLQQFKARDDVPEEAKRIAEQQILMEEDDIPDVTDLLTTPKTDVETPTKPGPIPKQTGQVDSETRLEMIKRIAAERQKTKHDTSDEITADIEILADEFTPKLVDEVPKPKVSKKSIEKQKQAQKDIEDFLGLKLDGFEDGIVKQEDKMEIGFDDVQYLADEPMPGDIPDEWLEEIESGTRTWDEVLQDLYDVFGKKVGLTVEDVSKTSADTDEALKRLAGDFLKHEQKAIKQGLQLQEYYEQMGWDANTAARFVKYTESFHRKQREEVYEYARQVREKQEEARENMDKSFRGIMSKISVEHPFQKIGAHETGFMIKNHESTVEMFGEEGKKLINQIRKETNINDDEAYLAVLKAEDPNYELSGITKESQARIEQTAKMWNDYAEKSFQDYKEAKLLTKPFPESAIERREDLIRQWKYRLETVKDTKKIEKLQGKIAAAEEDIELMRGKKYVPILREWFDKLSKSNDAAFRRALKIHAQKQRKTPILQTLVEEGLVTKEELDIRNMIGYYARRKGQDLAKANIINAMENDGLIQRINERDIHGKIIKRKKLGGKKQSWTRLPATEFPALKDYALHPVVADYLSRYFRTVGEHDAWETVMNTTKMFQFFNPIILPMYDLYQFGMATWTAAHQAPGALKDGILSALRKDEDFWTAFKNGLFSKPYANPMGAYTLEIEQAKYGRLPQYMKQFEKGNLPMKKYIGKVFKGASVGTLRSTYNLSWEMAWQMDGMIRMGTYKALRKMNFEEREAAQLAALFHGDYASVPPALRKRLNKMLFTPTFKIAMAKAQSEMTKAAVKSMTDYGQFRLPNKRTRVLAGGLFGTLAANMAKDMVMTNLGFESDQWGRRYSRTVETDEGEKEIAITFSDPTNVMLKYLQNAYEVSTEPIPYNRDTAWGRFVNSAKYEAHPVLRIAFMEMTQNEKWDGSRMYSPNDPDWLKAGKSLEYLTGQIMPMLQLAGIGDRDNQDDEIIQKEFGKMWDKMARLVVFPYVRESKRSQARQLSNRIKQNILSDIKRGAYTPERQAEVQEQLKSLQEFINEQR